MALDANPDYRAGAPPMKRVVIRHVPEPAAQRLLIEKGDADIARDLSPDQVEGYQRQQGHRGHECRRAALHYVGLNLKTEPLPMSRCARRCTISSIMTAWSSPSSRGQAKVHQSFWPSGFWASLDETPYSFDPAKAKQLLAGRRLSERLRGRRSTPRTPRPYTNIAQSMQATHGARRRSR